MNSLQVTLISILFLHGCQTMNEALYWASTESSHVINYFSSSSRFFSRELVNLFPKAERFEQRYQLASQAGKGIKLIDIKRLSDSQGAHHEENLSWSNDGRLLGYELASHGQRSIQVIDLEKKYEKTLGTSMVVAPTRGNRQKHRKRDFNAYLRWSHDSKSFSFMSNAKRGSYNIHLGTLFESERVIAENPAKDGFATWSPTGSELVFSSARSGPANIYLYSDEGTSRAITHSSENDLYPEWLKNGSGVFYVASGHEQQKIKIVLRNRGFATWKQPFRMTNSGQSEMRPIVSPNGAHVAFFRKDSKNHWNINVVAVDPNHVYSEAELDRSVVAKNVYLDLNTGVAWSPDSQKVFYVANDPLRLNPIYGYDLYSGRRFVLQTKTSMNRDLIMSKLGVLSFCAQTGPWDRVYLALTNQGLGLQMMATSYQQVKRKKIKYL